MPAPSFSVFVDTPLPEPKSQPVGKSNPLTSVDVDGAVSTILGLVAFTNKENLDPITGERLNPEASKKRKSSIVGLKGLAEGKVKDTPDSQPDAKKRKASGPALRTRSASTSAIPVKKSSKPASTSAGSNKRPVRKTRRAPMPKLEEEEAEVQGKTLEEPVSPILSQAQVDTKCKDLTVLPLADVSEAFESHAGFPDTLGDAPSKGDELESTKSPFVRVSGVLITRYSLLLTRNAIGLLD